MNCHSPIPSGHDDLFDNDDPFLPNYERGAARLIDCADCGYEHRADFGCTVALRESQANSAKVLVWIAIGIIWCVCGALIAQAVWG